MKMQNKKKKETRTQKKLQGKELVAKIKEKLKRREPTEQELSEAELRTFFDVVAPGAIKFFPAYFIMGSSYRSIWAITGYPYDTQDQAILDDIAAQPGVTLRTFTSIITEQKSNAIIENAQRKNSYRLQQGNAADAAKAQNNMSDLAKLLVQKSRNKEPLLDVTVLLELRATSQEQLVALQTDVRRLLKVKKIEVDELYLLQEDIFPAICPGGRLPEKNKYGRIMPASSAANLYPLNYSGHNDSEGFYLGKDKYGSDIIVDIDGRSADKTNSHAVILGNSGEGKSYLLKLLGMNLRQRGKSIVAIDPDGELYDWTVNQGGVYIDYSSSSRVIINPLQVRKWESDDSADVQSPLSLHIAFLRDFFRSYKPFTTEQLDSIEIFLQELYKEFNIFDFNLATVTRWPLLSDLYALIQKRYQHFEAMQQKTEKSLYTEELLRSIALSLHTMCVGSDSHYFNGETNVVEAKVVTFGFKQLLDTNEHLLNAMLFNTFSYLHHTMLSRGGTVGVIDELHLFLNYRVALSYIRSDMKRSRKNDSSYILASQNINDFLLPEIREYTKPLFSIPTHSFLFYPGNIDSAEFIDTLSLKEQEFRLISEPNRGSCLYRCGSERFLLQVHAPEYKAALFGTGGGR